MRSRAGWQSIHVLKPPTMIPCTSKLLPPTMPYVVRCCPFLFYFSLQERKGPRTTSKTRSMPLKQLLLSDETMQGRTDVILNRCFKFLCLGDLLRCRATARRLQQFVKTHFIPDISASHIFFVTPRFRGGERVHSNSVRCQQCKLCTPSTVKTCPRCNASLTADKGEVHRLFIGQLCVHRTTLLASWFLRMLWPSMEILRIHAHTSRGGQGRGCAWAYVGNSNDEKRILSLDRRALLDIPRGEPREGFRLVCHAPEAIDELRRYALRRVTQPGFPMKPLVVERPAGTGKNRHSPPETPKSSLLSLPQNQDMLSPAMSEQHHQRMPIAIPAPRSGSAPTSPVFSIAPHVALPHAGADRRPQLDHRQSPNQPFPLHLLHAPQRPEHYPQAGSSHFPASSALRVERVDLRQDPFHAGRGPQASGFGQDPSSVTPYRRPRHQRPSRVVLNMDPDGPRRYSSNTGESQSIQSPLPQVIGAQSTGPGQLATARPSTTTGADPSHHHDLHHMREQ